MKTLFIADLHLSKTQPDIAEKFLRFLKTQARHARALYILGDLFEVWVGDDDATKFNQTIINALKKFTQTGPPIYIMHGNRDFLLGKRFFKASGCHFLKDPTVVNIYGERILLTHGDTLCSRDIKYLIFRKRTRKWIVKKLFLLHPLKKRKKIADKMRKASMAYNAMMPSIVTDASQKEIEHLMQEHHANILIHGHIHQSSLNHFKLNKETATRIVVGDWQTGKNNILTCSFNKVDNNLNFKLSDC